MAKCSECNGDGIIFYPNGSHKICNVCGGSGRIPDRFTAVDLLEVMGKVKQPQTSLKEKRIEKLKKLRHRLREGSLVEVLPDGASLRQNPSETDLNLAEVIDVLIELLEAQEGKDD